MKLTVDPVFKNRLRPLTGEEKSRLRDNLLRDGCLNPIVYWKGRAVIIDGHHRYEICEVNNITYQTIAVEFADEEEAITWIDANQDGRRNETEQEKRYRRGKAYNERKKVHGTNRYSGKKSGHGDHSRKTEEIIAAEYGVGNRTIRRDAKYAEALDELSTADRKRILQETPASVLSRDGEKCQGQEILARLKLGPADLRSLNTIAPNAKARISDLRAKGKNIVNDCGIYRLEKGEPQEKEAKPSRNGKYKVQLESRFRLPDEEHVAINRIRVLVRECRQAIGKGRYDTAWGKLHPRLNEMAELMKLFSAAK